MRPRVLALHGFTLNGATMKRQLGRLGDALSEHVELVYVDAPHACTDEAVRRLHERWKLTAHTPPHLRWWDASADGRHYVGWAETRALLARQLEQYSAIGVLGFSQGAMVAATVAALAEKGELPALEFAVMIAGRVPRAVELAPYFAWPIELPSLHVWGERDALTGHASPELADCFAPALRVTHVWPGPHAVPRFGAAAEEIVEFVRGRGQPPSGGR